MMYMVTVLTVTLSDSLLPPIKSKAQSRNANFLALHFFSSSLKIIRKNSFLLVLNVLE